MEPIATTLGLNQSPDSSLQLLQLVMSKLIRFVQNEVPYSMLFTDANAFIYVEKG